MTFKTLMMSAATAALLAGGAHAQSDSDSSDSDQMEQSQDSMQSDSDMSSDSTSTGAVEQPGEMSVDQALMDMTVGDVLGLTVEGVDGDNIGEIDYLIQGDNGLEAVIGIGGFLGLGEYTVALPLDEFSYNSENETLTLNTDQEALEQRPEFNEDGVESIPEDVMISELVGSGSMGSDSEMGSSTEMGTSSSMGSSSDSDTSMEDAGDSMENAAEETGDTMENAAEETGDSMENAAEETGDAVSNAADEASDAAGDAANAAGDAAEDAGDAAENAAEEATDSDSENSNN